MVAKTTAESKPLFIEAVWAQARVGSNASLAGKISESLRKLAHGEPLPEGYFRVDDLKNPAAAYWARKAPGVEESPDVARRMASGKRKHMQAGFWFQNLPDFVLGEGRLEGAYVGIQGVVGKIDFLLGRSVLEYKTKDGLPETPTDVWDRYPHDLEQTLFYAVLLPNASDTHYLLFDDHGSFRAFRIRLLDRVAAKALLAHRIRELREALDRGDPTRLGRCRYFESGCKFAKSAVCQCAHLATLDTGELRRAVELARDSDLETRVGQAYEKGTVSHDEIWWWDLFSPRRRFLEEPPTYTSSTEKNAARWLLEEGIRRMGLPADKERYKAAAERAASLGIRAPTGLLKVMRSGEPMGQETVPFIARAQRGEVRREWAVTPYYIAELGVACAAADSKRGVIFVVYPEAGNKVAAYDVSFPNLDRVKDLVTEGAALIRTAEETGNPKLLPECPAFMREGCSSRCLCRIDPGGGG